MAKISRPRSPAGVVAGIAAIFLRKASMSALLAFDGSLPFSEAMNRPSIEH